MSNDEIPPMRPVHEDAVPPDRWPNRSLLATIGLTIAFEVAAYFVTHLFHVPAGAVVMICGLIIAAMVLILVIRLRRVMHRKPEEPTE